MSDKTGGPAYPATISVNHTSGELGPYQFGDGDFKTPGMTLRDYFAAKAMQGYISIGTESLSNRANIAQMSYDMADAMLAARKE